MLKLLPKPVTTLRLQVLRDVQALENVRPEWTALLEHSASDEAMLTPDWLLTWWRVYGAGRELRVGLFFDGDRLVGLAPLCMRKHWRFPGLPSRRLEPLGSDYDTRPYRQLTRAAERLAHDLGGDSDDRQLSTREGKREVWCR